MFGIDGSFQSMQVVFLTGNYVCDRITGRPRGGTTGEGNRMQARAEHHF